MIKVVCWNIARRAEPWRELAEMAWQGQVDVALLQEAGNPPRDLKSQLPYKDDGSWNTHLHDRWCRVVALSDRVQVEPFRPVLPILKPAPHEFVVCGVGTIAAARVTPQGRPPEQAFIAVSMHARWTMPHPTTNSPWSAGASDVSAHRIISDLSTFIGHTDPSRHRLLAAGDLNMFFGATGHEMSLPQRERSVWTRFEALGLQFLGPQAPDGRQANTTPPDVPADTRNVPTHHSSRQSPAEADRQLDYAFASRGFHESISVRALNRGDEWGSSDHCRLLIEIDTA